jgi:hypothetical protein
VPGLCRPDASCGLSAGCGRSMDRDRRLKQKLGVLRGTSRARWFTSLFLPRSFFFLIHRRNPFVRFHLGAMSAALFSPAIVVIAVLLRLRLVVLLPVTPQSVRCLRCPYGDCRARRSN